jgi:hypothetical protein
MAEEFNEEVMEDHPANPGGDMDMVEGEEGEGGGVVNTSAELPFAEGGESDPHTTFISYLTSPIVTMIVGSGETETILTAHQGLLCQSPYFVEACAAFADDGSVGGALVYNPVCFLAQR